MNLDFLVIGAVLLPLIGMLHRFAANYGYRHMPADRAWAEAWRVGAVLTLFSAVILMIASAGGMP